MNLFEKARIIRAQPIANLSHLEKAEAMMAEGLASVEAGHCSYYTGHIGKLVIDPHFLIPRDSLDAIFSPASMSGIFMRVSKEKKAALDAVHNAKFGRNLRHTTGFKTTIDAEVVTVTCPTGEVTTFTFAELHVEPPGIEPRAAPGKRRASVAVTINLESGDGTVSMLTKNGEEITGPVKRSPKKEKVAEFPQNCCRFCHLDLKIYKEGACINCYGKSVKYRTTPRHEVRCKGCNVLKPFYCGHNYGHPSEINKQYCEECYIAEKKKIDGAYLPMLHPVRVCTSCGQYGLNNHIKRESAFATTHTKEECDRKNLELIVASYSDGSTNANYDKRYKVVSDVCESCWKATKKRQVEERRLNKAMLGLKLIGKI